MSKALKASEQKAISLTMAIKLLYLLALLLSVSCVKR